MHEWTNSRLYNFVAWTSVALMIGPDHESIGRALGDSRYDADVI